MNISATSYYGFAALVLSLVFIISANAQPRGRAPKAAPAKTSEAEAFFIAGKKCPAADLDCQISNYTKAINLNVDKVEAFKNRGNAYLKKEVYDKAVADFTLAMELDPNDASLYVSRGITKAKTAKTEAESTAAIKDFSDAIELEPKQADAYKQRGIAYFLRRDIERAKADLEKALSLDPNDSQTYVEQAKIYMTVRENAKAIEVLNRSIVLDPENMEAYSQRGSAYSREKNYPMAIADYSRIITAEPENIRVLSIRASLYKNNSEHEKAVKDYDRIIELKPGEFYYMQRALVYRAMKNNDAAVNDFEKALEMNSRYSAPYEELGKLYLETKDYQNALKIAERAISVNPEMENPYSVRANAKFFLNGNVADGTYKTDMDRFYTLSIQNNTKILERSPGYAEGYYRRALGFQGTNQIALALQDIEKAVQLNPEKPDYHITRGTLLMVSNVSVRKPEVYQQMIDSYSKAIELDPENSGYYQIRAGGYGITGAYELAIKDHNYVIEKKPNDPNTYIGLYSLYAYSMKNYSKAIEVLDNAIAVEPSFADGYWYKGTLTHVFMNQPQNALQHYLKAIELKPANVNYYDSLSKCYVSMKNEKEALNVLNLAISKNPNSAQAYSNRAYYYRFTKNNRDMAIGDYQKAASLDPSNSHYSDSASSLYQEKEASKQRKRDAFKAVMDGLSQGMQNMQRP